jgi:transcriptional regulator with XRE-family HTH domain
MDGVDIRLRMARARTKQTQREIADAACVSLAMVQRAEDGKHVPRIQSLELLAKALGVRLAWLVSGEGPMLT